MREIKFRAWLKELKQMVEVYEIVFTRKGYSIRIKGFEHRHYRTFKQDEIELIQFTGRLDKNKKAIYEGGIVIALGENEETGEDITWKGVIEYQEYSFRIKQKGTDYTPNLSNYCIKSLELIGDIFNNPELLENNGTSSNS